MKVQTNWGWGMKKRIKIFISGILILTLVLGITFTHGVNALIPGSNSLINYDTSGNPTGLTNQTSRVSEDGNIIAWTTNMHNIISGDPYASSTATVVYERNIQTGVTKYATPLNTSSTLVSIVDSNFAISRTGRYVVFMSQNTNVVSSPTVPSPGTNVHIYLTDTQLGTTTLVDQSAIGVLANNDSTSNYSLNVSDDGRYVLFSSNATNLLSSGNPSSAAPNFYIKDMQSGQVINPTVSNSGSRANGSLTRMFSSCDGSILAFSSNSTNLTAQDRGLWDTFIVDLRNGYSISNLTYSANQPASVMSMSCNGRYLVLVSNATNLTSDSFSGTAYHYFRYDRLTGTYALVDKSTSGYISTTQTPSSGGLGNSTLASDDGKIVFFDNDHNMISPSATNNGEIYIRDPEANTTSLIPINASGVEENAVPSNTALEINARGTVVIYNTTASNLVPGITTGAKKLVLSKLQ